MHALFVYGTLRDPELRERLLSRAVPSSPATLPGYRAARLRNRVYPGLLPAPDATAVGALIDVDDRELLVLDRFEGEQYRRIGVRVQAGGEELVAAAWRLRDEFGSFALAEDWSYEAYLADDAHGFVHGSRPGRTHPGSDLGQRRR